MVQHSKRFRKLAAKVPEQPVELDEAVKILLGFGGTKFEQSVEMSMNLGIDPRQSDQLVRGAISMPHGIGKSVRLAVFARGDNETKAKEAGADLVGAEDLAAQIRDGMMDFDVALATPDMMGVVGPLGKLLGPRGLMPTPKNGTVTTEIANAVKEFKAGKVEYRNDPGGNLHVVVGRTSFDAEKLAENCRALVQAVRAAKPNAVKGTYIKSVTISATMSPGVPIAI